MKHLLYNVDEDLGTGTESALRGSFHVTDMLSTMKTWLYVTKITNSCRLAHAHAPVTSNIGDQVIKASSLLLSSLHAQDANTYIWSTVLC